MSPFKPPKPRHQPLIEGDAEHPAALRRAQNAAEQVFSRHLKPRVEKAMKAVAPLVERGGRAALLKLADPARARVLQKSMAGLAQWTMDTGFQLDPHARLLFDFVDTLEQDHSREVVLKIIARHASSYERDMLALMVKAARGASHSGPPGFADGDLPDFLKEFMGLNTAKSTPPKDTRSTKDASKEGEEFRRQRERLGDSLLDLLCELAALESDQPPPHERGAQQAYFEDAPIEARFKRLAKMAAGDPEAFAAHAQDDPPDTQAQAPRRDQSLREKVVGSRLGRLFRRDSKAPQDAAQADVKAPVKSRPAPPEGMLARFIPSLNDPATRFLTTSHLFFLQSYLMRTTIEGLPEMLATVADLEREEELKQDNIMTIDALDAPPYKPGD